MTQRLKVKEMVIQMHEKNLVLVNILRDIAENETSCHVPSGATMEEIVRCLADKAVRRTEILGEIRHVLLQEDAVRREPGRASETLTVQR
ncbi:hypothetical protein [Rhizobium rhizophilum]|uniref:CARD domain-containing protein n=1 Tax=Rhizobium rhizophilum TaxID=1850373 RepID=A0ABY2QRI0_9HYPH|nr:hypothetical protein [Rhizobium rhizophilum]THV12341.1 hypothetical protein E9677_16275 [Rhizobium rhizophilum]